MDKAKKREGRRIKKRKIQQSFLEDSKTMKERC